MRRTVVMRSIRVLLLAACVPWLMGAACTDPRGDQVRTEIAPAVSGLFGAMGDFFGAFSAGLIKPLPEATEAESSLK